MVVDWTHHETDPLVIGARRAPFRLNEAESSGQRIDFIS